ncbi:MAG: tetratricopeptide repeat protein [Prevotellaceae bacterium]|nr:tetratricopeptide repeat protein [Prevotellaceae bacterium]
MKIFRLFALSGIIALAACSGNVSELIKKAEQGDADAQLEYARLLKTSGNGVEQDWKKAVEMIQLSAEKGNHDAEWELGALYEFANHMTQDSAKAIEWYRKSADAGSPIGLYMLAHCYQHGIAIEENHHISDSLYAKSVEELTKLASQEDMYVLNFLGSAYYWGDGVKEDRKKAFEYYLTSAKKGNPETQYKIGNCYETAQGTEKDMEKAKEWYRKSADQGYQDALDALERLWKK